MESEAGPSNRRTAAVIDPEADADTASHSSSTSIPGGEYQVFLSFRAPDTRYSFTDFLYTSLIKSRVRTFQDDEELRKGNEIGRELRKAICESRISIPIFSKNYAYSKWCLMELELMVECYRIMGQLILPIFYDVTPEEVKDQSGSYGEAFQEHKKSGSFSDDTIDQWKKALKEVGHLKGWDLKAEADGYEGKLVIDEIVPKVLSVLKMKLMDLTKNLVGMDHHEKEMMRLLNIASDDVQIVGIYGMGGIGKTTVAKFMYNKLLENFECCSFLENVRERAQELLGLVSLQNLLLSDTLNWSPGIANVDNGIAIIKQKFCNKKVLIVLDDVNSISQFHCLVGERGCFGKGSKIVVTTKNKGVLNALKVGWTYELPLMNAVQSIQLFSKHAFNMEFPPKEYDSISKKIASFAGGLPLALESMGSSLFEVKDPEIWEDASNRFAETLNCDVWKKLRVDYEALNRGQRKIFLDIACLFAGMDKRIVFYLWDDCGYYPKTEFNDLYLMSLVKVGDANELLMHTQLKALGKKIVNDEKVLANRSRLWNHKEALHLLEQQIGTAQVEALSLCFQFASEEKKPCFRSEQFNGLVNLRYLRVDGADLVGDFNHVLLSLRWLNWRGCPRDFKVTNFRMKNLVILDLSYSGITEDWEGWNHIKIANKLKVLQLANCALRRTPDFSSYATLEILILQHCESLVEIDRSIGNMKNLKVLDISYADIRKLPDEIWMLEKLEVIDFTCSSYLSGDIPSNMGKLSSLKFLSFCDTKIQSLPTSTWELSCLQTLNLGGCTELQSQPELPSSLRVLYVASIPNLTNLVNLHELHFVGGCECVEIPRNIGLLSKLEKLTLDSTNIRILPKEMGVFSQLKVLHVQSCDDLRCILGLPSSLVDLSLAHCDSLEKLPDLSNLKDLLKLSLNSCSRLTEVQGLGKLESVTSLDINACDRLANLENLQDLSNLKKLEILCITDCPELYVILGLDRLESLKYLDLHDCENLFEIVGLEALKNLEVLNLSGCTSLGTKLNMPNMHTEMEFEAGPSKRRIKSEMDSEERPITALCSSSMCLRFPEKRKKRLGTRLQDASGGAVEGEKKRKTEESYKGVQNMQWGMHAAKIRDRWQTLRVLFKAMNAFRGANTKGLSARSSLKAKKSESPSVTSDIREPWKKLRLLFKVVNAFKRAKLKLKFQLS